jgi:hypothetical protein
MEVYFDVHIKNTNRWNLKNPEFSFKKQYDASFILVTIGGMNGFKR